MNKRKLNVLFLISSLERGGSERQMINLAAGLIGLGHRAEIGTLVMPGSLAEEARERGIPVIDLSGGSGSLLRGLLGLRKFVRTNRPDVIHPYLPRDNALVSLLRPLLRPSNVVWGVRASNVDLTKYRRTSRYLWPFVVKMSHRADMLIANSEAGARFHIAEGYPADRIHVVHNGIDTNVYRTDTEGGLEFRLQHGIDPNVPVVGLIARFDPMKGQDRFVEIIYLVRSRISNVHALLVGKHNSSEGTALLDAFKANGLGDQVTLINVLEKPEVALNSCDVVALTSRFGEGFTNVLAEALACGVPAVAFDVGDSKLISSLVCPVVEQNNIDAFASAVVNMIKRPPDRDVLRRHIEENFGLEQLALRTADLLQQLLIDHGK